MPNVMRVVSSFRASMCETKISTSFPVSSVRPHRRSSLLEVSAASRKKSKQTGQGTSPQKRTAQEPTVLNSARPVGKEEQGVQGTNVDEKKSTGTEDGAGFKQPKSSGVSGAAAKQRNPDQQVKSGPGVPSAAQGSDQTTSSPPQKRSKGAQPLPPQPVPPVRAGSQDTAQGAAAAGQSAPSAAGPSQPVDATAQGAGSTALMESTIPARGPSGVSSKAAAGEEQLPAGGRAEQEGRAAETGTEHEQEGAKVAPAVAPAAAVAAEEQLGDAAVQKGDRDAQPSVQPSPPGEEPADGASAGAAAVQENGDGREEEASVEAPTAPGLEMPTGTVAGGKLGERSAPGSGGSNGSQAEAQVAAMEQLGRIPVLSPSQQPSSGGGELVFEDESGQRIPVMTADYGFRSGGSRLYQQGSEGWVPASGIKLAFANLDKELKALRRAVRFGEPDGGTSLPDEGNRVTRAVSAAGRSVGNAFYKLDCWLEEKGLLPKIKPAIPRTLREGGLSQEELQVLLKLEGLQLDDDQVTWRERQRAIKGQKPKAPWVISLTYNSLCWLLDVIFVGRPIQRFWFLETVARMPYFAYISMLHLYESLGWWRAGAELRKVHFAQEWNELHHLQIMESLGGDQRWVDRFLAEHAAVFYYWVLVLFYLISPKWSYVLMELIEGHAADTYTQFAEQNEEVLKTIPPPMVALNYYKSGDLYLFDQLQTGWEGKEPRRPPCNNLYDVFINIRDDELEHTQTMSACKDGTIALGFQDNGQLGAYRQGSAQHIKVLDVSEAGAPGAKQWVTSTDLSSGSSDEGVGSSGRQ